MAKKYSPHPFGYHQEMMIDEIISKGYISIYQHCKTSRSSFAQHDAWRSITTAAKRHNSGTCPKTCQICANSFDGRISKIVKNDSSSGLKFLLYNPTPEEWAHKSALITLQLLAGLAPSILLLDYLYPDVLNLASRYYYDGRDGLVANLSPDYPRFTAQIKIKNAVNFTRHIRQDIEYILQGYYDAEAAYEAWLCMANQESKKVLEDFERFLGFQPAGNDDNIFKGVVQALMVHFQIFLDSPR